MSMPGTDAQPLFPQPEEGDPEDVGWALSTAEALWKRGEHADAITWVRRAAEAASEAEQDMRMLVLVKAAGELAALAEAFANPVPVVPSEPAPPPEEPVAVVAPPPAPLPVVEDVAPVSAEPVSSGRLTTESIELDVDAVVEAAPPERKGEVVGSKKPPPKPPPRPPARPAAPANARPVEPVPTPNPFPSPLRALAMNVPTRDGEGGEELVSDPPPPLPHAMGEDESLPHVPTVPPPPPDFAPTPMAMRVAPSVPPESGPRPESPPAPAPPKAAPPRPAEAKTDAGRVPPRPASRVAAGSVRPSVPSGSVRPGGLELDGLDETPALGAALLTAPSASARPRPEPPRPEPPRPEPPRPKSAFPAATKAEPEPEPSAPEPVPSAPPKPLTSLRPPTITTADGVQDQVSDAPPRAAASPAVAIPRAPRAPDVGDLAARPALKRTPTPRDGFPSTPEPPSTHAKPVASVRDIVLDPERFEVLADVPDDAREALVADSEKQVLLPDELQAAPPMVVVLSGELEVRAPGYITRLDVIGQGQVRLLAPIAPAESALQVIGGPKGARYLAVPDSAVEALRVSAPWVVQELEPGSDDVHVVAGALIGKLGARLDGGILDAVLARAKTMRLPPNATVVKQGEVVRALIFVGAGELSLRAGIDTDAMEIGTLELGDVVFPAELLARSPAPSTVRAGDRGALVIVATRSATEELLVTVPPLLELLGEG